MRLNGIKLHTYLHRTSATSHAPIDTSRLNEPDYPDLNGSSLAKENRNQASDSDKLRILTGLGTSML